MTLTRDGESFKEKTTIDGVPYEVTIKLNESFEFKEKEENPAYHAKVIQGYRDRWFEPHQKHYGVSLSKKLNPLLSAVST